MSNQINTTIVESLVERLEAYQGILNVHEYQDKLWELERYVAENDFAGAEQLVRMVEDEYRGELAVSQLDEPEPLETDVY